ncbi:MAG TPA: TetR/AcrR family transcriptional regulator [Gaiellaceae bacterium]|nr:TetR/AcrR family transcriptional regulator [Gaiellaceae bacterium]
MTTRDGAERRRRADGERSRRAILEAAAQLATTEGLEGLSIGHLAERIGMSKSGLYAHFGSKEELQLATVDTAREIFEAEVVRPTETITDPLSRLEALCEQFLSHVERRVFAGGCFFASAAAELDTRPGVVQERVVELQQQWEETLERLVRDARAEGELDADEDPAQLVFEIDAYLLSGNTGFVLNGDPRPLHQARTAVRARLAGARPVPRVRRGSAARG